MNLRLFIAVLLAGICASSGAAFPNLACSGDEMTDASNAAAARLVTLPGGYCIQLGAGVFYPSSAKARDRFGSSWFGYGISLASATVCETRMSLGVDLSLVAQTSGDNYVYLLPVGVCLTYRFLGLHNVHPYVGVCTDVVFSDIRSIPDNVNAKVRTGAELGLAGGVFFGNCLQLQARYNFISQLAGFDLSGLSLSVNFGI